MIIIGKKQEYISKVLDKSSWNNLIMSHIFDIREEHEDFKNAMIFISQNNAEVAVSL